MTRVLRRWVTPVFLVAGTALFAASPAEATFNGANGKIAFQSGNAIATINPDGTGFTTLGGGPCQNKDAAWSPDGARIAYAREASPCTGNFDIAIMNADGTDQHVLSGADTAEFEQQPTWNRFGTEIAFFEGGRIFKVNHFGGTPTQLSNPNSGAGQFDEAPDWNPRPGSNQIVFQRNNSSLVGDIWGMDDDGSDEAAIFGASSAANERAPSLHPTANGTLVIQRDNDIWVVQGGSPTNLTNTAGFEADPAWSPDGTKITFSSSAGVEVMNANGTGRAVLHTGNNPSWQRLANYVRPAGATTTRLALVPAFDDCTDPNGLDPELNNSCIAPVQTSGHLTIGTNDFNGRGTKSVGSVKLISVVGDATTAADEADLQIVVNITDVRKKSDLSDYTGGLLLTFGVKKTAKDNVVLGANPAGSTLGGTTQSFPVQAAIPCTATADTTVGSTCSATTSADALDVPVVERRRTIWEVDDVAVYDGGPDGNPQTGPNTLFEVPGNFIP